MRRRGHTLVEIAAAIAVLTVIAGAGVWIGAAQTRGILRARQDDAARLAAEARIAVLRGRPESCVVGARDFAPEIADVASLPGAAGTESFEPAGDGLVRADVEVAWDAADGGRRSVRLATLVAQEAPR